MLIDRVGQQLVTRTKPDRSHFGGGKVPTIGGELPDSDRSLPSQNLADNSAGRDNGGMILGQNVGRIASGNGAVETGVGSSIEDWNRYGGFGTLSNGPIGKLLQYGSRVFAALTGDVAPIAGLPDLSRDHIGATLIGPHKSSGNR